MTVGFWLFWGFFVWEYIKFKFEKKTMFDNSTRNSMDLTGSIMIILNNEIVCRLTNNAQHPDGGH